jgi:hypothetical protein
VNTGRSRVLIVTVMLVSLAAAGVTRALTEGQRRASLQARGSGAAQADASLNELNSYALALLLGGLRGPLVMVLWSSSESQKSERDLEDFDTKIEMIRLLQPEFDTVHIFQIWNKAYNVSAQLASLPNKYAAIVDAIDYARRVLEQRPDNTNVMYQLADVYAVKLGDSTEKLYYAERVRQETRTDPPETRLRSGSTLGRRMRLDRMVDDRGMILPEFLQVTRERPSYVPENKPYLTGEELQFLKEYQPFEQGIPPLALGYNYYKKAQVLMDSYRLHHAQIADSVVDRRPAIALSIWGGDEMTWGRRREIEAMGHKVQGTIEETLLDLATAEEPIVPTKKPDAAKIAAALDHYACAAQVCEQAEQEYQRFLTGGRLTNQPLAAHVDDVILRRHMALADVAYLKAMMADGEERRQYAASAAENYTKARNQVFATLLKYYVPTNVAAIVLPEGVDRTNLGTLSPDEYESYAQQAFQVMAAAGVETTEIEARTHYLNSAQRADQRLKQIALMPKATQPASTRAAR